jgi:hypothetical protein
MAKQRVINTRFWDDDFVMDLSPTEKLMYLYLLTNPLTDICGAYEITLKRMMFDTGLQRDKILAAIERFENDGKILYRDGWMIVRNFAKNQVQNPKVKKGIERTLNLCPDWVKHSLSKPIHGVSKDTVLKLEPELKPEPIGVETHKAASPPKGTRLPEPFNLTKEMRAYAAEKRPNLDVLEETEKFTNYWRAKTGRDATKLDWLATWQNWILNARGKGNGSYQTYNGKPTSLDRIEEHRGVIDQYPTEAELRRIP